MFLYFLLQLGNTSVRHHCSYAIKLIWHYMSFLAMRPCNDNVINICQNRSKAIGFCKATFCSNLLDTGPVGMDLSFLFQKFCDLTPCGKSCEHSLNKLLSKIVTKLWIKPLWTGNYCFYCSSCEISQNCLPKLSVLLQAIYSPNLVVIAFLKPHNIWFTIYFPYMRGKDGFWMTVKHFYLKVAPDPGI